jgi:hypothetical protein
MIRRSGASSTQRVAKEVDIHWMTKRDYYSRRQGALEEADLMSGLIRCD